MQDTWHERDLEVLLSFLLNKQLTQSEVILALGISRSAYYDQKERGTLPSCNNIINAARYFGLNPLDLLVHYGHVTPDEVEQYWSRSNSVLTPDGDGDGRGKSDPKRKGAVAVLRKRSSESSSRRQHHLGPAI